MLQCDLVRGPEHEREAWRPHRRVPAAVRDGVTRRVRRQMESQVVAVRSSADQPVLDDPVLAGDEQDAALPIEDVESVPHTLEQRLPAKIGPAFGGLSCVARRHRLVLLQTTCAECSMYRRKAQ